MSTGRTIALVTDALEAGGLETALFALGRVLAVAGYRPHLITTRAPGAWFDRAAGHGLPATFLSTGHETGLVASFAHVRRVAAHLAGFDAVVLAHAHDAQAGIGMLPAATPIVSILQCDVEEVYDVGLANAAGLNAVVGVSAPVVRRARARVGDRTHVACIPNFTEVAAEKPGRSRAAGGRLELLFAGRLVPHKGVRHLVPVLAGLRARGVDARLTVLGEGPERAPLDAAVRDAGLASSVRLRGLVSPDEVRASMRSSDALFLPTQWEGLPLVVVEAMAEGAVPVVSQLPVMGDVVTHDKDGLTFAVGDEAGMVDALARLADDARREALSRAAHATARERFSSERCGADWLRLFEDAFAGRLVPARSRRWLPPVHPGPVVPWAEVVPGALRALVRPLRRRGRGR
jgi:glycosyltransferase involved in cell wall biosynthesis